MESSSGAGNGSLTSRPGPARYKSNTPDASAAGGNRGRESGTTHLKQTLTLAVR